MTPKQTADVLAISPRTLERLVAAGKLHRLQIGLRAVRFHPDEIERFLAEARTYQMTRSGRKPLHRG